MNNINKVKDLLSLVKNTKFYLIAAGIILVILLLIIIINRKKYQWLKKISIPTLFVSIILISLKLFFTNTIINFINNKTDETVKVILTPFIKTLLNNLFTYGLILLAIGIIMLTVYFITKKYHK